MILQDIVHRASKYKHDRFSLSLSFSFSLSIVLSACVVFCTVWTDVHADDEQHIKHGAADDGSESDVAFRDECCDESSCELGCRTASSLCVHAQKNRLNG